MGLFNRTKPPETGTEQPAANADTAKPSTASTQAVRGETPATATSSALPSSPSPTSAAPAPAGDPAAQELLKELAKKIGQLAGTAESERDAVKKFTDRVEKMEDRLEMFQILFESLSLKYNPFIGKEESDAFEGQAPLLDREPVGAANGARLDEPTVDVPIGSGPLPAAWNPGTPSAHPGHADGNGHAAPARRAANSEVVPVKPAAQHAPPVTAPTAPPKPVTRPAEAVYAVRAPGYVPASPWGNPPVQGARESYLALCWFETLYKSVEPQVALRFLDYYLELGWLTPQAHEWLRHLALAVAPPPEAGVIAESVQAKQLTPVQIVRLHKSSLRFFDHVFRFSMDKSERRHLERAVRGLVERG